MKAHGKKILLVCGLSLMAPLASAQTLLLQYNFDEASSGNTPALDLGIAPAANGTFVGTATRTASTPGGFSLGGLNLTSTTSPDHVSGGTPTKLDALTQFTLTGWINLQGAPANGNRIMAKQLTTSPTFEGFSFAFSNPTSGTISASNFQLNLALGSSSFAFNTSGANMSADNQWTFVAVSYDGTQNANNVLFYNGTELDTVGQFGVAGTAAVGTLGANANEFRVGSSSAGAGGSPPMLMDDVRVYNGVLSLSQLDAVRLEAVPEPSTWALLGMGVFGLLQLRRRK